jgi:peptidoglycan hydrolase-like protein with peptidoglycan-binding domain
VPRWGAGVVLQFGNVGNAVLALQRALNAVDVFGVRNITEDGKFGMQTQTAVKNFEALAKIAIDTGVAGAQVRNALIHMGLISAAGVPA